MLSEIIYDRIENLGFEGISIKHLLSPGKL